MLPFQQGLQPIPGTTTTIVDFPNRSHSISPLINSTTQQVEQIVFYQTQDASGNPTLNQIVLTEGSGGPNTPWTVGTPTQILGPLTGIQIEQVRSSNTTITSGGPPTLG